MTTLIRLFGVTALAAFVVTLLRRAPTPALYDFRAIACIAGGLLGALLIGASQQQWVAAGRFLVAAKAMGQAQRLAAAAWFQLARRATLAAGVLTYAVGVIALLASLSSPAAAGWGLATALMSVVYSTLASEFIFSPLAAAASANSEPASHPPVDRFALLYTALAVASITLPTALVLSLLG